MNITLKTAALSDLENIRNLYERLLDSSEDYSTILQWKKGIYPTEKDWVFYIEKEEMYLVLADDTQLVGAVVVTKAQTQDYRNISWQIQVEDDKASVIHLLAVAPEYHGNGFAPMILNEIMKMAAEMGKYAVRLDAIHTNTPAQRLYERYGFVKCGTTQLYYESTGYTEFIFYEYLL